jgi:hypothetical protein
LIASDGVGDQLQIGCSGAPTSSGAGITRSNGNLVGAGVLLAGLAAVGLTFAPPKPSTLAALPPVAVPMQSGLASNVAK